MAVLQAEMAHARHLAVLVEIDRQDFAVEHRGREEGDLLLGRGNIIPGVAAEGGGGGGIAQPLLDGGLGVGAGLDGGFDLGIGADSRAG